MSWGQVFQAETRSIINGSPDAHFLHTTNIPKSTSKNTEMNHSTRHRRSKRLASEQNEGSKTKTLLAHPSLTGLEKAAAFETEQAVWITKKKHSNSHILQSPTRYYTDQLSCQTQRKLLWSYRRPCCTLRIKAMENVSYKLNFPALLQSYYELSRPLSHNKAGKFSKYTMHPYFSERKNLKAKYFTNHSRRNWIVLSSGV